MQLHIKLESEYTFVALLTIVLYEFSVTKINLNLQIRQSCGEKTHTLRQKISVKENGF